MKKDLGESKLISVWLPVFCVVLAAAVGYNQYHRLTQARSDLDKANLELQSIERKIQESKQAMENDRVPTVTSTKEEDTQFLNGLKKAAVETGVQIVRWSAKAPDTALQGGPPPPAALKGITTVESNLEVYGPYESVRAFVVRLESAPRLLNMNHISWHRGQYTGTRLAMTLTRYVSEPGASSADKGPQSPVVTGAGGTK